MRICPRCSELYPDDAIRCSKDGSDLRSVLDPLIGKTVGGRYRLISRLGSGGMSSVYLARHVLIDRLMAIKTLRRDLAQDPVQRDRFIREARAVNRINHENIVEITDFGETEDGLVYLVMEYVPGESLLEIMASGPMDAGRALNMCHQMGLALARAHQMGVVHRDLKPENVLLMQRPNKPDFIKILDFGIAKILDAPSLTGSQQIFGTPGYIAPEYIQSTQIDGRADLYSLGVILYELVTGALPFDYEYPGDLLVKHVTEQPIAPSERLPTLPAPVEELILKCLKKDPAARFRDAFHFIDELTKVRERIGSSALWGDMGERSSAPPRTQLRGGVQPPQDPQAPDELRDELKDTDQADDALRDTHDETRAKGVSKGTIPDGPGPQATQAPGEQRLPVRDTVEQSRPSVPQARPVTQGYERPSIPEPPSVEALSIPIDIEIAIGQQGDNGHNRPPSKTPPPTPFDPERDGLLAVRRWRRRFDAIRGLLDEIEVERQLPGPAEITRAMAFASRTLEEFESCAKEASEQQRELEELGEQARDFRATLGKGIDSLAAKLSHMRGELEELVTRRDELRGKREATRKKVRLGEAKEGDADALLWELAAVEEEVRAAAGRCDELELKLSELQTQLDSKNEEVESEQARLTQVLDGQMVRIESMAASLRGPLEHAEEFILQHWEDSAARKLDGSPTPHESL